MLNARRYLNRILPAVALLASTACTDEVPEPQQTPEPPVLTADDALLYHDYVRENVYPKLNNEVYLNPPPLMIPTSWRGDSLVQFEVSADAAFGDNVYRSDANPWAMASPHRRLEPGRWYWRYRNIATDGTEGNWSLAIPFDVPADAPEFATPSLDDFERSLPSAHPRLDLYVNANLEAARAGIKDHSEYKAMISRATTAMSLDISDISVYYANKAGSEQLNYAVNHLYQAWMLTQDEQYATKLLEILHAMVMRPANDSELYQGDSNFQPSNIAQCYARIYDCFFNRIPAGERASAENFMFGIVRRLSKAHIGSQEGNLFDSHFWQHNMLGVFQCAYMLYDKMTYRDECLSALKYYYELWTTRAPGSGYNRDGVWHNSAAYFDANMETLHYMPLILSEITGFDFLSHPWYQNAGKSLPYTWPTGSQSCGFGDSSDTGTPSRLRVAMADFLARHTGDEYAGWYADQNRSLLLSDFVFRLDRMVNSFGYSNARPDNIKKLIWYKDSGEAVIHSDLADTDSDLAVSFKSSRFGSTQHTYANQNAFNILYRGENVFRNTGHYFKYASPHHIMDYRHTRAHNTIMVDGIGQAFAPEAYGNIVRGIESDNITYLMGDASHAYTDTCNLKVWINNFINAGLTQSRENGFGSTPLTRYQRHILMLGNKTVVVYDDIETSSPAEINWLLNNRDEFTVGPDGATFTVENREKGFAADSRLFASAPFSTKFTTDFFYPTPSKAQYPDHWHYMATTDRRQTFRFLFVLKVRDLADSPLVITPDASGAITVDGWEITAGLTDDSPSLRIVNSANGASFVLTPTSGKINDTVNGETTTLETTDYTTLHTRSL